MDFTFINLNIFQNFEEGKVLEPQAKRPRMKMAHIAKRTASPIKSFKKRKLLLRHQIHIPRSWLGALDHF